MQFSILSGFILALFVPFLHKRSQKYSVWLISALPLFLTFYFFNKLLLVFDIGSYREFQPWFSHLQLNLSFLVDGLSLLFALLISGIGTFIILYASAYLEGQCHLGRFYALILVFMSSMLGLVFAENLITLFIFWELTSVSSYFLIGYHHNQESSRVAALQALLVTGIGGLAMLAGFILLGQISGSMDLSVLLNDNFQLHNHPAYLPILILILIGAFSKSAQFPFHFWLPNAMQAPTPVSAYLHSSTMVMGGVYLLARLSPILSGSVVWNVILSVFGILTMIVAGYFCLTQNILKRLLAYSTIGSLGLLVMLLGIGSRLAIMAAMTYLIAHALYKAALFMVTGCIDHSTGETNIDRLGGLRKKMPMTTIAALISGLSMAGIPPLFAFIAKEQILEASLHASKGATIYVGAVLLMRIAFFVVMLYVCVKPFLGSEISTPKLAHEPSFRMWGPPMVLGVLSLIFGLFSPQFVTSLIQHASEAVLNQPAKVKLVLWHGFTPALGLSFISLLVGMTVYYFRTSVRKFLSPLKRLWVFGPEATYFQSLKGLLLIAKKQTRVIQDGNLRHYIMITLTTAIILIAYPLLIKCGHFLKFDSISRIQPFELGLAAIILAATFFTIRAKTRLAAVFSLSVVGFSVILIFVFYSAPDLAMTLIAVETLTVILLVFVLYHLPSFEHHPIQLSHRFDILISVCFGLLISTLVFLSTQVQFYPPVSSYFIENSFPLAHGRNIVNVILVSFRGLDTLGEITVFLIAGLGVYALLKLNFRKRDQI